MIVCAVLTFCSTRSLSLCGAAAAMLHVIANHAVEHVALADASSHEPGSKIIQV